MNKILSKVIFAGAVQNAENHLASVFENIENISKLFDEAAYIFVENDSFDNTKKLLNDWGKNKTNFHLVNFDGLKSIPIRTLRLEMIRNSYIETIRYTNKLKDFNYLIVLDTDNSFAINSINVENALEFLNDSSTKAAVFSNQKGFYFDMWALRLYPQCPGDIWEDVLDYSVKNMCTDEIAFEEQFAKRIFSIAESSSPIQVDSAFGGLGIYKMNFVLNNPNPYLGSKLKVLPREDGQLNYLKLQICEHVHFHAGIKSQGGEMYIFPKMINGVSSDFSPRPSTFREMIF